MTTKKIVHAGVYIALGLILPLAFHGMGAGGKVFLPMHIPVLLGGFGLGPVLGLIIGLLTPLLSSLLTGMPPMAILPLMMAELGTYGLVTGFLYRKCKYNVYVSLLLGLLAGRIVNLLLWWLLAQGFGLHFELTAFLTGMFVTALPGIALQLVLLPLLVKRTEKFNFH